MIKIFQFSLILLTLHSTLGFAGTYSISQEKKNFSQKEITINVGDTIEFPNKDPFFHNVYSLSAPKSFELGSYPPGMSRSVVFDKAGVVDVRCAIHQGMKLKVIVKPKQ